MKRYMNNDLMLFPVSSQQGFDFDTMIGDKSYATIAGVPVKVDRIIKDITKTSVLGISGTMIIRGVKVRGLWDMYGNIVKCKEIMSLFTPKSLFTNINTLFEGTTADIFRLVSVQELENKK